MSESDARRGAAPLARARHLTEALHELLVEERRALLVAEPDALLALAARKRHLLATLSGLDPDLGTALARVPADEPLRTELVSRLRECRALNRENGLAAGTAMHRARATLELLRGTLALEDLTLYDGRGALSVRRERRGRGSA